MGGRESCTIEEFASLIGKLVSLCPATTYGWLYTKVLEREKYLALRASNNCYKANMPISPSAKRDLEWWQQNLSKESAPLHQSDFDTTIFTDASRSGWGAKMGQQKAYGFWGKDEKEHHINYLELLAIKLALRNLADDRRGQRLLLRVDNTTAIAYVNKMGGIQYEKYNELAREIWQWAEARSNFLCASYISSAENSDADSLSRIKNPDTEWSLDLNTFSNITKHLGKPD